MQDEVDRLDAVWQRMCMEREDEAHRYEHETCATCRDFRDVHDRIDARGRDYTDDLPVAVCMSGGIDWPRIVDNGPEQAACEDWEGR